MLLLALGFWLMYRRGLKKGRRPQDAKETPPGLDTLDASDARRAELEHKTPTRHEAWVPWNLELESRQVPGELGGGYDRVELA